MYVQFVIPFIEYGLGVLTLPKTQLTRGNEDYLRMHKRHSYIGHEIFAGTTDHGREMTERHYVAQVKAFLRAYSDNGHPLHSSSMIPRVNI
jgi:hypothetical protein